MVSFRRLIALQRWSREPESESESESEPEPVAEGEQEVEQEAFAHRKRVQTSNLQPEYNFMHIFLGFFFGISVASAWWFIKAHAAAETIEAVLAFIKESNMRENELDGRE